MDNIQIHIVNNKQQKIIN